MAVPNNPVRVFSSQGMGVIPASAAGVPGTMATLLKKVFSEKFDQKPVISFFITDEKGYLTINANTHSVGGVVIVSGANESALNDKFFILEKPDANLLVLDCTGMSNMGGSGPMVAEVMGLDWNMPYTSGTTGFVVRPKDLRYTGGFFQFDDNSLKSNFIQCAYFGSMSGWDTGTDKDTYQWARRTSGTGGSSWTAVEHGSFFIIGDNMTMYILFHLGGSASSPLISLYSIGKMNSVFGKSTYSTYYSGTSTNMTALAGAWNSSADTSSLVTNSSYWYYSYALNYGIRSAMSPYSGLKSQLIQAPIYNGTQYGPALFCSSGNVTTSGPRISNIWPTDTPILEFDRIKLNEGTKHIGYFRGIRKSDNYFEMVYWDAQRPISTMQTNNGKIVLFKCFNMNSSTYASSCGMFPFSAFTTWDLEDDY